MRVWCYIVVLESPSGTHKEQKSKPNFQSPLKRTCSNPPRKVGTRNRCQESSYHTKWKLHEIQLSYNYLCPLLQLIPEYNKDCFEYHSLNYSGCASQEFLIQASLQSANTFNFSAWTIAMSRRRWSRTIGRITTLKYYKLFKWCHQYLQRRSSRVQLVDCACAE